MHVDIVHIYPSGGEADKLNTKNNNVDSLELSGFGESEVWEVLCVVCTNKKPWGFGENG